jgi:hypothetical protein
LQLVRGLEHFGPVSLCDTLLVLLFWHGLGFSLFVPSFPLLGALFNRICQDTFSFLHLIPGNCLMFVNVHIPPRKGRIFTLITLIIY